MAATLVPVNSDPGPISTADPALAEQPEDATCHCCGLVEECTVGYIAAVSERYNGRGICGLCTETVNDEICRSKRLISTEEAVSRHVSFCKQFRVCGAPPEVNTAERFIAAVRQILRRSLDSPRAVCLPAVTGTENSNV